MYCGHSFLSDVGSKHYQATYNSDNWSTDNGTFSDTFIVVINKLLLESVARRQIMLFCSINFLIQGPH